MDNVREIIVIDGAPKPEGNPDEIWKPIPGFEGYEASNQGRIRSLDRKIRAYNSHGNIGWRLYRGKMLSPSNKGAKSGHYQHVMIGKGNYNYSGEDVHKLVMLAFVGPYPSSDHEIAHIDGNPTNNHLSNLRYSTFAEQYQDRIRHGRDNRGTRHYATRLTESDIHAIRNSALNMSTLADRYHVSKTTIHQIRNRLTWRWLNG